MGDLEDVAKRVTHHGPAVSVGRFQRFLHRESTGIESAAIGGIRIVDIDVQEGSERIPLDRGRDHHQRVSDQDLGGATRLERTCRSEHRPKKVHLCFHVLDENASVTEWKPTRGLFDGMSKYPIEPVKWGTLTP